MACWSKQFKRSRFEFLPARSFYAVDENGRKVKCNVFFCCYAATKALSSLPHPPPPPSLQRQTEKRGGQNVERAGEQVLFLWLSPCSKEEVKTFSPLITRQTT